jgi:hypothetical protein
MPGNIPAHLRRNGRLADQYFDPDETLYIRVEPEHINGEYVDMAGIHFPDISVNRGKYSDPVDVLIGKPDWYIAHFQVRHIPPGHCMPDGTEYEYRVEHDPIDTPGQENFSHSEIRAFKNQGQHNPVKCFQRDLKVPPTEKARFRQMLADKARPLR